jgi:hypothetical protein
MRHVSNTDLWVEVPEAQVASDETLFEVANAFAGYEVWGGLRIVQRITAEVATTYRHDGTLPESLTVLRTALFGEARSERFVDYGGFSDSDAGWNEHRAWMRALLEAIAAHLAAGSEREDENETALRWLTETAPAVDPAPDCDETPVALDAEDTIAAVRLAARLLARDHAAGQKLRESRMRDHLARALGHLTGRAIATERAITIPEFQGVGPVDIAMPTDGGPAVGLIECKWSTDHTRDKIYEAAWDAVKLALAIREALTAAGYLITSAPATSWQRTEVADLFTSGTVNTRELWDRPLDPPGLERTTTVGASLEAGGYGNMFTHAPDQLAIELLTEVPVPGTDHIIKIARVALGSHRMIRFAPDPEFPMTITQRWLDEHVLAMPQDAYGRLIHRLRQKRWTDDELDTKVRPLRQTTPPTG